MDGYLAHSTVPCLTNAHGNGSRFAKNDFWGKSTIDQFGRCQQSMGLLRWGTGPICFRCDDFDQIIAHSSFLFLHVNTFPLVCAWKSVASILFAEHWRCQRKHSIAFLRTQRTHSPSLEYWIWNLPFDVFLQYIEWLFCAWPPLVCPVCRLVFVCLVAWAVSAYIPVFQAFADRVFSWITIFCSPTIHLLLPLLCLAKTWA